MFLRNLLIAIGGIAVLTGLVLAAIWFSHSATTTDVARESIPPRSVLVATRLLPAGTLLRPDDVAWKTDSEATLNPSAIVQGSASEGEYFGAVTRRPFDAGESLLTTALVKSGDRAFLSAALGPEGRAVSIAVDAPQSVAGLILPGDRVDVILTQNFESDASGLGRKAVGETVLRNIRVIAVDQWINTVAKPVAKQQAMGSASSQTPATLTLEVTELQAQRVMVAVQLGKIQLSVRALEGSGAAQGAGTEDGAATWAGDVSPALRVLAGRPVVASDRSSPQRSPAGLESRRSIEVMHGSKSDLR